MQGSARRDDAMMMQYSLIDYQAWLRDYSEDYSVGMLICQMIGNAGR